jgi:hypothetical protein
MTNQVPYTKTTEPARKSTSQLGFWSAVLTAVFTASALTIGITTPPRSGPFCASSCVTYPYTDAAAFVPRDYLWMYAGFLLALIFVVLMACIHHIASGEKKIFSQVGLPFALISATVLATDYFIQLAVMQPAFLKGETEGLSLFSQYNPHGIFIALEDLGYLMMSIAFLFFAMVFDGHNRIERAIRWLFIASFVLAVGSLVVLALLYGKNLDYRFEVTAILINWTVLIVSGVLLSVFFKRVEGK